MKYIDQSVKDFTEVLASSSPTPGGGGASALIGAIGISLGDMVGELTVGRKKYAAVEEDMKALIKEAQEVRQVFLGLIDADAEVFAPLAKAYGIPKDDPGRDRVMEEALKNACSVPMEIMRTCCRALDLIREFAQKGSALAISDAGCAAAGCKAALKAASLNVFINTKAMKDRPYAETLEAEAEAMLETGSKSADMIFDDVLGRIRQG